MISLFQKSRLTSLLKLFKQAFGEYKAQIFVLTIFGFLSGLVEGIGVNALIPLFSFVISNGEGSDDFISKMIEKLFLYLNIDFGIKYLLIFILLLFALKTLITIFLGYFRIRIISNYEEKTRGNLLTYLLQADWPYLIRQKLGHLETVLMLDIPASKTLLNQISNATVLVTGVVIYAVVAINISPPVTIITLAMGVLIFLVFKPFVHKMRFFGRQKIATNKEIVHLVNENILGIKTVKTMLVGEQVAAKGRNYFSKLKELEIKTFLFNFIPSPLIQFIGILYICLVFAFAYKSSSLSLVVLPAIIYLIHRIFSYIQQLQTNMNNFSRLIPHLASVMSHQKKALKNKEIDSGKDAFIFDKELTFQNLSFAYQENRNVLSNIDLTIKKGTQVGLIGPSGAGKTTLVDLILRLLTPMSGKILLDEKDISTIKLKRWRDSIGYVSQDIFLINDTIASNIRFYNQSITDNKMEEAAKMANIYDFIVELPDKFNTIIGERGILLSAGQRQRIVIARILARNPKLLILDEATSSLDNKSEVQIQKVIKNLKGKITVFAIAHRLSTVMDSDKLFILEKGNISEYGSPQELLKRKDSYFFKTYNIRR